MRSRSLPDWLAWQESLNPAEIELGLDRVRLVAQQLDFSPPAGAVFVVAGTNGKGSCSAILEAILRASGSRVGVYSSPHLVRYNERIRVNGEDATDADLENAFVNMIKDLIPSEWYLGFLRYVIAWFNKDLDDYIPLENQLEIYGVSNYADPNFSFIGKNYQRILNYHAAHDIGHAMQNLNLVACTSFGVWDEFSSDSSLLIGRNFDFHAGEEFADNKIIAFYSPRDGYEFAMITWGGMTGVVSGMNMEGLSITLNAAKSEIPFGARTPVSIVARNILQYAANIEEAYDLAKGFEIFVSETFFIGFFSVKALLVIVFFDGSS